MFEELFWELVQLKFLSKVLCLNAMIVKRKCQSTLLMVNGLSQVNVFKLNVIQDSLLLRSILQRQVSFNELDSKKSITISKMWMLEKCQRQLIVNFEMIKLILASLEMLWLSVESWKLRFRMNRKASIIEEEDRMQTKDFMQATLKSIASKTQIMKSLETMSMLDELSLIK